MIVKLCLKTHLKQNNDLLKIILKKKYINKKVKSLLNWPNM